VFSNVTPMSMNKVIIIMMAAAMNLQAYVYEHQHNRLHASNHLSYGTNVVDETHRTRYSKPSPRTLAIPVTLPCQAQRDLNGFATSR